jgi:hypothetical protein
MAWRQESSLETPKMKGEMTWIDSGQGLEHCFGKEL